MATAIKIKCLPEPELQFSNGRRDLDPRRALAVNGPADHRGMRTIRVGLIGLAEEYSAARAWIATHGGLQAGPGAQFAAFPRLAGQREGIWSKVRGRPPVRQDDRQGLNTIGCSASI